MRFSITIGSDCSGHGKHDVFVLESNHSLLDMVDAYKNTCKLIGLQISGGEDYTGVGGSQLCSEYQECTASKQDYDQFLKFGIDLQQYSTDIVDTKSLDRYVYLNNPQLFMDLVIDFIKLSLPSLTCEEAYFKNSELNKYDAYGNALIEEITNRRDIDIQFGYGIYD